MTTIEKTPAEILAELEQQVAAKTIEVKGPDAATDRKIVTAKEDLEYLSLVQRFNAFGKQGQRYAIVDVTSHGKGFIVLVTGPKAEVHRKTISFLSKEDKLTDEKLLAIVYDYVQHPTREEFAAIIAETPDVQDMCVFAMKDLWGARARIRHEK